MSKVLFDYFVAVVALFFLLPIFLVIAIVIKLTSSGPIFYRGERTGQHGVSFKIFKFRTMVVNAEKLGGPTTGLNDPRVTKIGHFLRKYKLDELPQLINIVRGEMSFVGPRPEVKRYTDLFLGDEKLILTVRPGITDYSSIKFADLDYQVGAENIDQNFEAKILPEKNKLRIKYVKEQSFWLDLKLIFLTILRVIKK
ncbi:MAG: hypothetical protein A2504_11890 [Bdellovibrionales bacterium RIFOXYD12_FULL_39_22]|nr:MAG: hypothetical protein A2385_16405 [Bdellovibrionales bacterium RIFOXYB1_FULL_39_21]OFZ44462.1 MAG: hypothetical protein A2485_06490 [Bdellovibrionales bacterium RIFOXYC12_FULL_39_17]OFZ49896.1 MAG: hypothetical protein A2404_00975 [Bdellovibrionales bacterium RIFOXYC1_FULL_39_130]OFZ76901.1 MAG: hypothetical protein A2560_05775 [Bdellovibrionales bacterium RIFOXYD1_FULL_39_84]OFZ95828.1 MAG: hypothetical protein A2504_11890 [Bdellovibrionales bacterium RIFOXYD12_FULL_39_22]HLE10849.1 su